MAYCTQAQIESEFKSMTFSATTPVTDTDITRFIVEADAKIDSKLAVKYTTPITGANSLIVVRTIAIKLIKHRIERIINVKTPSAAGNQGEETSLLDEAEKELDDLAKGMAVLTDATLATSADGVKSYTSTTVSTTYERNFSIGETQW